MRRLQTLEKTGAVVVNKNDRHFEYQITSHKLNEIKMEIASIARQVVTILGSWAIVITMVSL